VSNAPGGKVAGLSTEISRPDTKAAELQLRMAQVRQLYSQSRVAALGAILGAVILTGTLWPVVPHYRLIVWLSLYAALHMARQLMISRFFEASARGEDITAWGSSFHVSAALGSLMWGLAGVFLFPTNPEHQFILAVCVTGISSAAMVTFVPTNCYLSCVMAGLVPLSGRFMYEGTETNVTIGVAILLYAAILAVTGRRMHLINSQSLMLRFEKDQLIVSLTREKNKVEQLNSVLKDEIHERNQAAKALKAARDELERRVEERTAELLKANYALQQSEAQYRGIVEGSFDGIFIQLRGKIIFANSRFYEILGYERGELDDLDRWQIYHPEDVAKVREREISRLRNKNLFTSYEVRLRRKDGRTIFVEFDSRAEIFHGEPCLQVCIRDITERKRAEEERVRLVTAIEQCAETVVVTDANGNVEYVNPAFERITGYAPREIIGRKLSALKSGKHDKAFYEKLWGTITSGEIWHGHFTNKKKDGTLFEEEATISPVRNEFGHIVNYVAVNRDVTREMTLERQLRQAQKMEAIGTLAGGIAHDFNNILFVINGYLEVALEEVTTGTPLAFCLEEAQKAGLRATDLVRQILSFCRQDEQERRPIRIEPIIKETLRFLRASIPKTIEIRQNIEPTFQSVVADPTQIHQVVMNLCTNAAYAMRETGGILEVSFDNAELDAGFTSHYPGFSPGSYLRLTVTDTGHGISPSTMERIFDPYFTTKPQGEGTGLGLAVLHGIVKGCGGIITVESEQSKGSAFHVFFPTVPKEEEPGVTEVSTAVGGHEKVLFVDDEPAVAELGKRLLSRLGYDVTTVHDGREASVLLASTPDDFDVVVTDMTMPHMTGAELAHELSVTNPNIPVILCTGFSDLIDEPKALALGIRAFVMKPFQTGNLATTIRRVLDNGRKQER
jgi:PAS domain S-box-containing protein